MNERTNLQYAPAPVERFKECLNSHEIKARLKNSLKNNWTQFQTSMLDLYSGDAYLQKCDPMAVALECVKAATLDLPISKSLGFAYVVPYNNVPTFTLGYKGLIQLAQRTGQYRTINADVVYEGEICGADKLSGMVDLGGERTGDEVVGYFAYFKLINGFEKMIYMNRAEAEKWRDDYSPSAKSKYSPWRTDFDKMALKTCIRRLISKYGIMSVEMQGVMTEEAEPRAAAAAKRAEETVQANANSKVIDIDAAQPAANESPAEAAPQPDF